MTYVPLARYDFLAQILRDNPHEWMKCAPSFGPQRSVRTALQRRLGAGDVQFRWGPKDELRARFLVKAVV